MTALTRFVLRHRLLVTLVWLALAVTGALTAKTTTHRLTTSFAMPGNAFTTETRIEQTYGAGAQDPIIPVVTLPKGETVNSPGVQTQLQKTFEAAHTVLPVARITDYPTTHDNVFVTSDGRTTFAMVFPPQTNPVEGAGIPDAVEHAVQRAAPNNWNVRVTGIAALTDTKAAKGAGVLVESMLGALGALAVLAFVFASFLALVPLVMAGVSILTTFLALLALTGITDISAIVEFLIALIGLGVAIDYSLLVVTRWREERAHGRDNITAVEAAMASAGRAVVFSGLTVGIGLLALVVLPVPFLRSAGIGGVLIPFVSVAVAVTLLPVLLATVGPRLDWPRLRHEDIASRGWTRWAKFTVRRRALAAAAGLAVLTALIVPAFSMHVGEPRSSALAPTGAAHSALADLQEGGVAAGILTPIDVLTTATDATSLSRTLETVPGVATVLAPRTREFRMAHTALITVVPTAETNITAGQETVEQVRAAVIPDKNVVGVAGSGASTLDFAHDVYGSFPLMLSLIALATFVLLARAFRSLLLPFKAVVMNLLSLSAAYGIMVLVWQTGHGSTIVWGIPATGAITMWVPVMVFAFLFGLSMDYEVFILARMRESYDATGDTRTAVIDGIGRTGRLVSSAALILVLSFLAMSTGPQTDLKILATGLGAGIFVDATVIRCLLVPALVALFDRWNWWLPGIVARMLRVPSSPASAAGASVEVHAEPIAVQ